MRPTAKRRDEGVTPNGLMVATHLTAGCGHPALQGNVRDFE